MLSANVELTLCPLAAIIDVAAAYRLFRNSLRFIVANYRTAPPRAEAGSSGAPAVSANRCRGDNSLPGTIKPKEISNGHFRALLQ